MTTTMFAVAADSPAEASARARVQALGRGLGGAVGGVGAVRASGPAMEETSTKRPWPLAREGVVEGAGGVLDGADEEVVEPLVVVERSGGERLAALPAADEVKEAVDAAEALLERLRPVAGAVVVEQVGDARVAALLGQGELGDELVEPALVDVGERQGRAGVGQPRGDGRAEATGGAGDRDHAPFEIDHPGEPSQPDRTAGGRTAVGSLDRASTRLP